MTETEARADPAQEPEENTEEEPEQLAVWWEDKRYSGLLDDRWKQLFPKLVLLLKPIVQIEKLVPSLTARCLMSLSPFQQGKASR